MFFLCPAKFLVMNTTLKSLIRATSISRSCTVSTATKSVFAIKTNQIHTSKFNANKNNNKPPVNILQQSQEKDSAWQRFRRIFAKTMMVSKDELTRGNMWEYHQLKKYPDGKVFPAQTLKQPMQFPLFEIRRIYDLNGQLVKLKQYFASAPHGVTFVICSQKREFASKIIQSWKKPFQEKFPEINCAELISVPLSYRIANPLLKSILKRTNKKEDWPNVLQIKEAWIDMSPQALGGVDMENSFLGYVFVVDKNSNIHWRAVGIAKDYEMDSLFKIVSDLKAQHAKQLEKLQDAKNEENNSEKPAETTNNTQKPSNK